ncbi:MAG TPA: CCA tRNA nucleotidyltransferase [Xanthobacteraceae bacterium]|nr:CCA tRNA nucleotidyltransferase [Xanthobacteraceae bacterium]
MSAAHPRLTRESAPWLFEGAMPKLFAVLDADGEEARAVGGAVRNALLGLPVREVDLATTATPDVVMRRATAAGMRVVPTGIEHGTVTVVVNDRPFEVTTLRRDVETDGRHAVVRFGRDWKADALRRDFTINAMSADRDGKVFDFAGGMKDIAARRVRFIGNATTRIAEDYLRILRFFRFHAAYSDGGLPDADGLAACIAAREQLASLSRERVRSELLKLLLAPHATPTLAVMSETGILIDVLAGVPWLASFSNMAKAEADYDLEPDATRRLGALAVRVREDAERLRERLRLTNDETRRLRTMAEHWWQVAPDMGPVARRAVLYRIGNDNYRDRVLLALSRAEEKTDEAGWSELYALPEEWLVPKCPYTAQQFLDKGVEKGPALGSILARAETAWVESGFPEEWDVLYAIRDWAIEQEKERGGE